ncbi:MAG: Hsp20/alpha crystallin family protein [Chloroflexota bacterium]
MGIRRWEPFSELMSMRETLDRLFEDRFRGGPAEWMGLSSPAVDMYQTDKEIVVRAAVPGVKPEDIDVSVLGDTLTIRGELKNDEEVKRENYYYQERRYGSFSRTVNLPMQVEAEQAKAKFENGVLTLTLPKSEQAKAKKIQISDGGEPKELGQSRQAGAAGAQPEMNT